MPGSGAVARKKHIHRALDDLFHFRSVEFLLHAKDCAQPQSGFAELGKLLSRQFQIVDVELPPFHRLRQIVDQPVAPHFRPAGVKIAPQLGEAVALGDTDAKALLGKIRQHESQYMLGRNRQDLPRRRGLIYHVKRAVGHLLALDSHHLDKKQPFVREIAIERRLGDTGLPRNIIDAGPLEPMRQKDLTRARKHLFKLATRANDRSGIPHMRLSSSFGSINRLVQFQQPQQSDCCFDIERIYTWNRSKEGQWMRFLTQRKRFDDLSEQEVLALAISSEEDDARIYRGYAETLRADYPASAKLFEGMAAEEDQHRARLIDLHEQRFGPTIPLIRREHVAGYYNRRPVWLMENLGIERIREEAEAMERDAEQFYTKAAGRTSDTATRKLLGDLAAAEAGHQNTAADLADAHLDGDARDLENANSRRQFILTWVQPGLAGLMDGSVSTLAPIFATAFATHNTWTTFLVGVAASVGAGISMGFTEAASDDGELSGRGSPIKRGLASGVMTTMGGLGHALPYLITDFWTATIIAIIVVFIELWAIAWIQNKYMETPFFRAAFQVVLGGALVLAAGILIGSG